MSLGGLGSLSTRHTANFFETIRGKEKLTSPFAEGATSQVMTHYANIANRAGKTSLEIDDESGRIFGVENKRKDGSFKCNCKKNKAGNKVGFIF